MPSLEYQSLNKDIPRFNFVEEYTVFHRIKFPRLVRLVRQARTSPNDKAIGLAAVNLAAELYLNNLAPWVQYIVDQGLVKVVPTVSASYQSIVPESYDFKSLLVNGGYLQYWVIRIVTCGLILDLSDISPVMPSVYQFDTFAVAAEDIRAAHRLVMCTEFSLRADTAIPLNSLSKIHPLQNSWVAWHRQEMREDSAIPGDPESPEVWYSRRMKQCCLDMANDLGVKWGLPEFTSTSWMRL